MCVCVRVCVRAGGRAGVRVCEVWLIDNREPVKNQGLRLWVTLNCSHYYSLSHVCHRWSHVSFHPHIHTHLDPSRTTLSFKRDLSAHVCGPTKQTHHTARHTNSINTYSSSWQQLHISVNNFPVSNHLELQNQIWMIWHIISKMQVMVNTNV